MLDTNIVSEVVRYPLGVTAERLGRMTRDMVCTIIVVAAEVRFGILRRGSARLSARVNEVLAGLDILPLAAPADVHYARLRTLLERQGQHIGQNDLLIAAHALALGCTIVTANVREFARVPGLVVENWPAHP
jgi:tRNA(fMet)-specific endonuclease VapC